MIYKAVMLLGIMLTFNGCFHIGSATEIKISGVTELEYKQIKRDVQSIAIKFNPPFDCDSNNDTWKINRDKGELICDNGILYADIIEQNISIVYDGGSSFWIPTKMIITDEHKNIQKVFLDLATKYKKKYQNVKVIFYHHDLPKGGKQLL